ncbi:helix-turn-helix transcriptional regulator [Streptomyces sp. GMY02]|uniref:response regulator transcription factor n=1 Tax=Streptomyces sp. GMY02 TaxID=1333528 RepID=UPI001C2BFA33|nr:helix-turn-helix transcriptional regulator [Streptomyces sp. GMY02]QXE34082.1 helix-turn-helix transcriptional regulator [Streptomyces sp. GMY02]
MGEAVETRAALVRLRRSTGLTVAFGGLTHEAGQLRITELHGTSTSALRGLGISSGHGLGGKSIAMARPCAVTDYREARHISHDYDAAVAAEGLRSVLAVPVVVRRRVRGVLYGALRSALPIGERAFDAVVAAARDVERALVVRDEVRRLLAVAHEATGVAGAREEIRAAHGELRALAPRIVDAEMRAEVLAVCGRLTGAARPVDAPVPPPVTLAPREVDVLRCVAAGSTNAATAKLLGLRPETVKGYLRSAMRRLGTHTRLEAVVAARRAGLLP